jgi:esterase/lipase superfamily enzyme
MRRIAVLSALVAAVLSATIFTSPARAEDCYSGLGCVATDRFKVADLDAANCQTLKTIREKLIAGRTPGSLTLTERSNMRAIRRAELKKQCAATAAKPKKAKTALAQPPESSEAAAPPPPAAARQETPQPKKDAEAATSEPTAVEPAPVKQRGLVLDQPVDGAGASGGESISKSAEPAMEAEAAAPSASPPAPAASAPGASPPRAAAQLAPRSAPAPAPAPAPEPAPAKDQVAATAAVPKPPAAANGGTTRDLGLGAPADAAYQVQKVYYATDRKPTGRVEPNFKYAGERGDLVYGTALVSIPKDHRVGELEAPSLIRLEFSEDPKTHVVLLKAAETPASEFYADVAKRVGDSKGKAAFIFVHGYNVTFKDAARRTAQMAYDLKFDGVPAFFSWPSQGTTLGYAYDEGNVEWAVPDLKIFIKDFVAKSGADNLYLIGHSMGTRALTSAAKELFQETPELKSRIREIILAAPDIDAEIFKRRIAPAFEGTDHMVTLYASSKDWALTLSKQFNGYARAGDSGSGLLVVPGVDTIEATDVDTDFVGHAYFMQSTSIISDIYHIVRGNTPPKQRPHLKEVAETVGAYWKMLRSTQETPVTP